MDAVLPLSDDLIIEIGPGTGALTELLAKRCSRVIAVEIDPQLVAYLASLQLPPNTAVVQADALKLDWDDLIAAAIGSDSQSYKNGKKRVRIVANLPYYISTPIIERLIKFTGRIHDMTLMLQNEVVDRVVAPPGSKTYGYLSILVQYYCVTAKLFEVPPLAFQPAPKVWSAVVKLTVRQRPSIDVDDEKRFFELVRAAFAQRRKTIANNLKAWSGSRRPVEHVLAEAGLDPRRRAETISMDEFAALYRSLHTAR